MPTTHGQRNHRINNLIMILSQSVVLICFSKFAFLRDEFFSFIIFVSFQHLEQVTNPRNITELLGMNGSLAWVRKGCLTKVFVYSMALL
jgi:hypothetical protein